MDSCKFWANDGHCDDGGPGSRSPICAVGTDCTDCGPSARDKLEPGAKCPSNTLPSSSSSSGVVEALAASQILAGSGCARLELTSDLGRRGSKTEVDGVFQKQPQKLFGRPVYQSRPSEYELTRYLFFLHLPGRARGGEWLVSKRLGSARSASDTLAFVKSDARTPETVSVAAVWQMKGGSGYQPLPGLQLACSSAPPFRVGGRLLLTVTAGGETALGFSQGIGYDGFRQALARMMHIDTDAVAIVQFSSYGDELQLDVQLAAPSVADAQELRTIAVADASSTGGDPWPKLKEELLRARAIGGAGGMRSDSVRVTVGTVRPAWSPPPKPTGAASVLRASAERGWTGQVAANVLRPSKLGWFSWGTSRQWLVFDLGSTDVVVTGIKLELWGTAANPQQCRVDASRSGTSLTDLSPRLLLDVPSASSKAHEAALPVPSGARFWRLFVLTNWGARWGTAIKRVHFNHGAQIASAAHGSQGWVSAAEAVESKAVAAALARGHLSAIAASAMLIAAAACCVCVCARRAQQRRYMSLQHSSHTRISVPEVAGGTKMHDYFASNAHNARVYVGGSRASEQRFAT